MRSTIGGLRMRIDSTREASVIPSVCRTIDSNKKRLKGVFNRATVVCYHLSG